MITSLFARTFQGKNLPPPANTGGERFAAVSGGRWAGEKTAGRDAPIRTGRAPKDKEKGRLQIP
jgi:hypothetical protein